MQSDGMQSDGMQSDKNEEVPSFVHLFTFWGREAPSTMQSDGMQSDGLLGGAPTSKSDKNEEVHYLKVWTT